VADFESNELGGVGELRIAEHDVEGTGGAAPWAIEERLERLLLFRRHLLVGEWRETAARELDGARIGRRRGALRSCKSGEEGGCQAAEKHAATHGSTPCGGV